MGWGRAKGGWLRSPYGDLPMLRADDTPTHQTWLILAGGMALILSRASKAELETRFAATRKVHLAAYARLQQRKLPKPDPALLRDALHEIANMADPMTREAGRECLARAVERAAVKSGAPLPSGGSPSTLTSSQGPSIQESTAQAAASTAMAAAEDEHEPTQIDLELLFNRSKRLRGTVAFARSTTFGENG